MADFDSRTSEEIIEILRWGTGVNISARYHTIENLITMARWAKSKETTLILRDTDNLDHEALIKIAKNGKKHVILEIRVSNMEPHRT